MWKRKYTQSFPPTSPAVWALASLPWEVLVPDHEPREKDGHPSMAVQLRTSMWCYILHPDNDKHIVKPKLGSHKTLLTVWDPLHFTEPSPSLALAH